MEWATHQNIYYQMKGASSIYKHVNSRSTMKNRTFSNPSHFPSIPSTYIKNQKGILANRRGINYPHVGNRSQTMFAIKITFAIINKELSSFLFICKWTDKTNHHFLPKLLQLSFFSLSLKEIVNVRDFCVEVLPLKYDVYFGIEIWHNYKWNLDCFFFY